MYVCMLYFDIMCLNYLLLYFTIETFTAAFCYKNEVIAIDFCFSLCDVCFGKKNLNFNVNMLFPLN